MQTIYDDLGTSSDEEIEGEAIYDENYLREKKRMKKAASSDEGDDEEYREEDEPEANQDDDDIDDSDEDDEDDYYRSSRGQRRLGKRKRKEHKLKSVDELQGGGELSWSRGLRRSKRATKSAVDYSKYDESEFEDEDNAGEYRDVQDRNRAKSSPNGSDASFGPSDNSFGRRDSDADSEDLPEVKVNKQKLERLNDWKGAVSPQDHDEKPNRGYGTGTSHQPIGPSQVRRDLNNGASQPGKHIAKADVKPHRFLDLNVAAPPGGGFEDAGGCSIQPYSDKPEDDRSFQPKSCDEDDDYFGDGGRVDISAGYGSNGFTPGVAFGGSVKRE